jgi:hypothetical protein
LNQRQASHASSLSYSPLPEHYHFEPLSRNDTKDGIPMTSFTGRSTQIDRKKRLQWQISQFVETA